MNILPAVDESEDVSSCWTRVVKASTRSVKEIRLFDVSDMDLLIEFTSFCCSSILTCWLYETIVLAPVANVVKRGTTLVNTPYNKYLGNDNFYYVFVAQSFNLLYYQHGSYLYNTYWESKLSINCVPNSKPIYDR